MIRHTLDAGQRIGDRYEIRRLLGSGGMADVYLARDDRLMRDIALKILRLDPSFDAGHADQQKERLLREARAAARLNHPGIVVIHDLGESGDLPFISMEYIDGRNLRDIQNYFLSKGHTMPVCDMLDIARQVAAALDYAHGQGVIHRDIKPENVMVTADGICKITDFGIARSQVAGLRTLTPHGRLACTFHYAAPEYFMSQPASSRGDQFSFGCVLYELLTGRFAFSAEEEHQIWYRITRVNPVPPGDLVFDLPEAVNAVVLRMLAKQPDDRFPTCGGAVAALDNALASLPDDRVFHVQPSCSSPETSTPPAGTAGVTGSVSPAEKPVGTSTLLAGMEADAAEFVRTARVVRPEPAEVTGAAPDPGAGPAGSLQPAAREILGDATQVMPGRNWPLAAGRWRTMPWRRWMYLAGGVLLIAVAAAAIWSMRSDPADGAHVLPAAVPVESRVDGAPTAMLEATPTVIAVVSQPTAPQETDKTQETHELTPATLQTPAAVSAASAKDAGSPPSAVARIRTQTPAASATPDTRDATPAVTPQRRPASTTPTHTSTPTPTHTPTATLASTATPMPTQPPAQAPAATTAATPAPVPTRTPAAKPEPWVPF